MSMKVDSLRKLFVHSLKDLYSAETQLLEALPRMAKAAHAPDLRAGFEEHLEQTQEHVRRIEKIFESLEMSPRGVRCAGMEGLIKEGEEVIKEVKEPDVRDAGLIAAAQKVEHYEIACYGTVCTYAEVLGDREAHDLLGRTLDEEKETDLKLTQLAESGINVAAAD
ncbi:MAG: ferritin-like domain-containing protein [Phycisphaeraceae bacterium]|nr:ferritin-like domain-containing protein [Phycisphaeraceae bacterium]